jgi:hypothetical protein
MTVTLPVKGSLNWDISLNAALTYLDNQTITLSGNALVNGQSAGGDLGGSLPSPTVVGTHLAAPLPVAQGGTGSATQNYVDLTTTQTVAGAKTFTNNIVASAASRVATTVTVGQTTSLGDNGVGELQLANATTAPTTNPTGGVVVYSQTGVAKIRNPQGLVSTQSGSVQSTIATVTIANSAALTALETFTVPAADAAAGAIYEMTGYGTFSVTGTPTLAFTLYWGGIAGTPIATVPAVTAASGITNAPFMFRAIVHFRTTTSATAVIHLNVDNSATTDAANSFVATPTAANTGLAVTASALTMGFTWSAASASNTISLLGGDVRRIA